VRGRDQRGAQRGEHDERVEVEDAAKAGPDGAVLHRYL
jgi:hypothetical protein